MADVSMILVHLIASGVAITIAMVGWLVRDMRRFKRDIRGDHQAVAEDIGSIEKFLRLMSRRLRHQGINTPHPDEDLDTDFVPNGGDIHEDE